MVTKMKMFGVLTNDQTKNNQHSQVRKSVVSFAPSSASQFNMVSIMKMQSTGCKSCRG